MRKSICQKTIGKQQQKIDWHGANLKKPLSCSVCTMADDDNNMSIVVMINRR